MEKALDIFQSRVARKIMGRQPRLGKDGSWVYPPLVGVMKEMGMVGIQTSILLRQNMVAQFIATRPILDLCEQATQRTGAQVYRKWWEHTGIDLEGAREKAAAAAAEPETEADLEAGSEEEPEVAAAKKRGGGVSGSERVQWRGAERGGGRLNLDFHWAGINVGYKHT